MCNRNACRVEGLGQEGTFVSTPWGSSRYRVAGRKAIDPAAWAMRFRMLLNTLGVFCLFRPYTAEFNNFHIPVSAQFVPDLYQTCGMSSCLISGGSDRTCQLHWAFSELPKWKLAWYGEHAEVKHKKLEGATVTVRFGPGMCFFVLDFAAHGQRIA
eukprot:2629913-Rhodomonas_salina.1